MRLANALGEMSGRPPASVLVSAHTRTTDAEPLTARHAGTRRCAGQRGPSRIGAVTWPLPPCGSPSHVAMTHVKPCTRESCTLRGTCRSTCRSRHISLTPERRPLPERSPPVVTGAPPTLKTSLPADPADQRGTGLRKRPAHRGPAASRRLAMQHGHVCGHLQLVHPVPGRDTVRKRPLMPLRVIAVMAGDKAANAVVLRVNSAHRTRVGLLTPQCSPAPDRLVRGW